MNKEEMLPDDLLDHIGKQLKNLREIPTWTQEKHNLFKAIERLAQKNKYKTFTGDCRDYHLQRKGDSCCYLVPTGQRGALGEFSGKRVRLICCGGWDSYSGRRYLVSTQFL